MRCWGDLDHQRVHIGTSEYCNPSRHCFGGAIENPRFMYRTQIVCEKKSQLHIYGSEHGSYETVYCEYRRSSTFTGRSLESVCIGLYPHHPRVSRGEAGNGRRNAPRVAPPP